MQENYKILVVDDDMRLRALLERYLTEQGFQVRSVANAEQMDRLLTRESFHLMVLDLMLPGEDGLSICRRLRSQSNPMPIIMVTAKGEEVDRIVGLEIGADDYIPKPFNPRELLARIRAVLRRQANELPGAPSQEEAVIAFGKFKLNLGTREMFREDEPMPLTSGEFAVLKALVSHPREPLSRDKLMNLARGREYSAMERSIDVQNIFHKMEQRTLVAAYKFYCGKDLADAHSAEADTLATYEVLKAQLDRYGELQNDVAALAEFSTRAESADFAGRILYNEKGEEVFGFGKYKGRSVADFFRVEPSYYSWMMNGDFPLYTKKIITEIRCREKNEKQ